MEYGKGCEGCTMCKGSKEINGYIDNKSYCRKCANAMCREYKRKNREKISTYNEKYKKENKEDISEYNKKYNIENRATIQARHTPYLANRKKTNPNYKMACTLRCRLLAALDGTKKSKKTEELVGCSFETFKLWMEFQFDDTMSFDNHGSHWHVDHVVPMAKFDLTKPEEQEKCCHWSNMQPLEAKKNIAKNDTADMDEIDKVLKLAKKFIKKNNLELKIPKYDRKEYCNK
jgi:hypothetical protein